MVIFGGGSSTISDGSWESFHYGADRLGLSPLGLQGLSSVYYFAFDFVIIRAMIIV